MPSFIKLGYVWQILDKGGFFASPNPWAAPKRLIQNKVNITNLATTTALTAVKNEIPDVINLVKKVDYDQKNQKKIFYYFWL